MADAKIPQPLDPHELMKWLTALRRATQPTAPPLFSHRP